MADMNITYGELQHVATQLTSGQGNIDSELSRLKSLVEQLVANGFTTDAASGAFQTAFSEFTSGATKVVEGLTGMSSYLNKAVQIYQSADEQLAKSLSSMG